LRIPACLNSCFHSGAMLFRSKVPSALIPMCCVCVTVITFETCMFEPAADLSFFLELLENQPPVFFSFFLPLSASTAPDLDVGFSAYNLDKNLTAPSLLENENPA